MTTRNIFTTKKEKLYAYQDFESVAFANNEHLDNLLGELKSKFKAETTRLNYFIMADIRKLKKEQREILDKHATLMDCPNGVKNRLDVRMIMNVTEQITKDLEVSNIDPTDIGVILMVNDADYLEVFVGLQRKSIETQQLIKPNDTPNPVLVAKVGNPLVMSELGIGLEQSTTIVGKTEEAIVSILEIENMISLSNLSKKIAEKVKGYRDRKSLKRRNGKGYGTLKNFIKLSPKLKKRGIVIQGENVIRS